MIYNTNRKLSSACLASMHNVNFYDILPYFSEVANSHFFPNPSIVLHWKSRP